MGRRRQKKNEFFLFCSRLFVNLHRKTKNNMRIFTQGHIKISHWLRRLLFTAIAAVCIDSSAQTPQCKDTVEHRRLQTAMWKATGGPDAATLYEAIRAFQKHVDAENDLEGHYSAWMCGVSYNLDRMNICDAYHIALLLKDDLKNGMGGQEEQYIGPMLLGQVHNVCGNVSGAITDLKEAITLVKGTRYEESIIISLYMALAHLTLDSDQDQSMEWINEGIKVLDGYKQSEVYHQKLAGSYAFKSIIYFKKGDYQSSRYWYDQFKALRQEAPEGYLGKFMGYADIYHQVLDGQVEEALKAIDNIKSMKERYLIKCDLYHYTGELEKAYATQRQLLLKNDSIRGKMMAENISQMERDIQMMTHQQEMAQQMNIVLMVAVALAILVIVLMACNILLRRRSRKELLAKNAELRAANSFVTAADNMKMEFIRNVSHEIRTPLNIINGFTQVLTNEENSFLPQERRQFADTIGENTQRITSLVNKMLSLANENTKDLLKEVEDTDALDICQKALREMPPVDAKRIKVELDDQTNGNGTTLCTNSGCLLKMLGNMLENSVKFTDEGYIRLTLRNDGQMMWFTVEDTGCGIPEEKISAIFDLFVKVDEFKQGLGLGLAYCHETAKRLGGNLRLDHTSEAGTSFTLGLPLNCKALTDIHEKDSLLKL